MIFEELNSSLQKLLRYIESESYSGYDPYDALTSPIFQHRLIEKSKIFRFVFQQLLKRFPFNVRAILGIPKGYNPVTLGLCIQAYTNLLDIYPERKTEFREKISFLISELRELIPDGFHGACWGYDFPWQARYAQIPAFQPHIVATGIITNALYICYKKTGAPEALALCKSAADFVLKDLHRTYDGDSFCFSYSPFDNQQVYNASAKGARLLAQVFSITGDESLKITAARVIAFIITRQQSNGSWHYSSAGKWVDNYHTGYVIDCLHEYSHCTGDESIRSSIEKGFEFYKAYFTTPEGIPKLYPHKIYPIDCTAAGQLMLTLSRMHETALATKVALWMISNMQSDAGYFYYRKYSLFTQKTSFMRWSNAWMLAGLCSTVSLMTNMTEK